MKNIYLLLCTTCLSMAEEKPNPRIDYQGFTSLTKEVAELRQTRRVSEDEFLRMAAEPGTLVLDARSREKYDQLHVKGAIHLNFSDFNEASLQKTIPAKTTRVLIYCNNNFKGEPRYLITKTAPTALNIPTYITLHGYGYTNIYELAPLLDIKTTKIPFAGKSVK
jgi:phage shock protein E